MLAISSSAASAIQNIVESPGMPDGAGLRIGPATTETGQEALGLSIVESPAETDQVVEEDGTQVFVAEEATDFLDDKVLEAQVAGEQVQFTISEQDEGPEPASEDGIVA